MARIYAVDGQGSLQNSATGEALRMICELDLSELQAIVPPRGFGRD